MLLMNPILNFMFNFPVIITLLAKEYSSEVLIQHGHFFCYIECQFLENICKTTENKQDLLIYESLVAHVHDYEGSKTFLSTDIDNCTKLYQKI